MHLSRYGTDPMRAVWSDAHRIGVWLRVLSSLCNEPTIGTLNATDVMCRTLTFELKSGHDVVAFLTAVTAMIPIDGPHFYRGLTSSNIVDTAQALIMREAVGIIQVHIKSLLRSMHYEHPTPVIERTHGRYAANSTWDTIMTSHGTEIDRCMGRLSMNTIELPGQADGPIGVDRDIDIKRVSNELQIPMTHSGMQIVCRDHLSRVVDALADLAAAVSRLATRMRLMLLEGTNEAELDQSIGSSSMPWKKNPSRLERATGLAHLVYVNKMSMLPGRVTWHARDIAHSSIERVVLPLVFCCAQQVILDVDHVLDDFRVKSKTRSFDVRPDEASWRDWQRTREKLWQ